jgi:flagellar basal body-associated protein FliL
LYKPKETGEKSMKKSKSFAWIIALLLAALMLAGCGQSVFAVTENTEKRMTITAEGPDKGDFFVVGSLAVDDGEQIVITSGLKKGSVRVEIIGTPEEQSMDQLPDTDGTAVITANLGSGDAVSGTVPAGSYLLRATCLERAAGTIVIEVVPIP